MLIVSGVTILLSLTVFLNLVAEKMPTTSDAVPLIGTPIRYSRIRVTGTSMILGRVRERPVTISEIPFYTNVRVFVLFFFFMWLLFQA